MIQFQPGKATETAEYIALLHPSNTLDRGEITRFNCKHVHATVEPQPDRWSIIVWQISNYGRKAHQQYLAQR